MKNYSETTWAELNANGHISPVRGIDAVSTTQIVEYLGVTAKELAAMRTKLTGQLKRLGMFTASMKNLFDQIQGAEKLSGFEYVLPLEDGSTAHVGSSPIVYYTAGAVALLADEIQGRRSNEKACTYKTAKTTKPVGEAIVCPAVFNNPDFGQIHVVEIDGEPWLVGKDVAAALGYGDTDQALRRHVDDEDRLTRQFNGSGQNRCVTVINESGLYSLALSSKLPGAKKFRRWVTSEVLPAIRKYGMYATENTLDKLMADPDTAIRLFTQMKEEQEKNKALAGKVAALEKRNNDLAYENHMLARKERIWSKRDIVVRLVRLYGHHACGGNFAYGWNEFYRELYYKKGINLKARQGDGLIIDRAKDVEWEDLISVAAAMCNSFDVDFSWAVNDTNANECWLNSEAE